MKKILLLLSFLHHTLHAFHLPPSYVRQQFPTSHRLRVLPETQNLIEATHHPTDVVLQNSHTLLDFFNIFSLFSLAPSNQDNFISQIYDPSKFQPVCPASDAVYQVTKVVSNNLIGQENVVEYGPLIASVLLRARLELCVVESFIYEAVVPFIQQRGLSWVSARCTIEQPIAFTLFLGSPSSRDV